MTQFSRQGARGWLPLLAVLAGILTAAGGAAAQQCTEEPCGPLEGNPPVISISPGSGSHAAGPMSVTVNFSDDYVLNHGSLQITYNGQDVTSAFSYVITNNQTTHATGTVTVAPGTNTFTAGICDASAGANCSSQSATYTGPPPSVRVTPEATALSVAGSTKAATRFRVVNTGAGTTTFTMITPCPSGFSACAASVPTVVLAAGDSAWVDVGFTPPASGSGWIQLSAASGSVSSFGGINVSVMAAPDLGFPGDAASLERTERDACVTVSVGPDVASECGDLRVVHALPSTRVLGKTRTPVLTYNSDHARPQPVVAEQLAGPAGAVPDSIRAVLLVNGTQVASQRWRGWGADQTRRIAVSFEASAYPTGVYTYTLQVTAEWLNGTHQPMRTRTGRMAIVNRSTSPFGAGWWLAGVEQLVTLPGDTVKLWVGGDGSARIYRGNPGGPWRAEAYDRPDSLYVGNSGELGPVTVRTLPNKSEVWFDAGGRHLRTINRMHRYTGFRWNGGYLEQVLTPYAPAQGDTARYIFEYNNNPTATVRHLSRVASPGLTSGTTRDTWLRTDALGRVLRIREPAGDSVTYAYLSSTRTMIQRTDRRGATHGFSYIRVRFHTSSRRLNASEIAVTRVQAVQTLGMLGVSVRADSVHVIYDGPRPGAEVCDCIWWKVDRWGAPTSMRNIAGQVTTYRRGDTRWPGLVTEVVAPNGFSTTAVYDAQGNPSSSTAWNPYADGRNATTTYTWDPFWNAPTRVVTPEGQLSMTKYDAYGRREWEQVGPDAARRVQYGYLPASHATAPHQLETVTDPRGGVERYAYDTRGNLASVTNPLLVTTEYLSDHLGRVTRVRTPVQTGSGTGFQTDSTIYDDREWVRETIATGPAMNGVGQQWLHVRNDYDPEGNLTQVERWSAPDDANVDTIRTRWEYDLGGRRIVEIAADSTPGTWADNPRDSTFYDLASNVVRVRTRRFAESLAANPADTTGAYIRTQYDALNRATRRILPAVRYAERREGMVTHIPLGMALKPYPYYPNDGWGLRIPADTSIFEYHPVTGLQDHAVNANARVRRRYYPNGQLQYDSLFTRTVAAAADFTTHQYGTEYRYDRNGRVTEMRHPTQLLPPVAAGQGQVGNRYGYDAVTGALSWVTDPMGNTFRYHYNVRGEPDSLVLPGGITHRYTYNVGGQLERHRITNASSGGSRYTGTTLRDETLGYDWRGKMIWARNAYGLRDTLTVSYSGLGQMARSNHKYWGWFTDTDQNTSYVAGETPVHDALGNIVSINRTGALQVYGSGLLEASHGRRNYTNGAFGYEPETGRLMERAEPGQNEFTQYDAAGNTVFTKAAPPGTDAGEMLDRASFYDGGGRLWAVDLRRVENGTARSSPQYFTFEEYRLDPLGRRVLVRARKSCDDVGDDRTCSMSSVRRTVWAGDQELYEIQMPEEQGENDTGQVAAMPLYDNGFDPNLFWGRVAYTYAGEIDRPLSIVRVGYVNQQPGVTNGLYRWEEFAVIPHWNAHGKAQSGTFHDGSRFHCRSGYTNWCVQLEWTDGLFPYNPETRILEHWHGTLLTEKRDASGLLYRRNRYYDPGTGRFTQEDPIGLAGGVNVYGFAAGDPVSYSDPYGLAPSCEPFCTGLDVALLAADINDIRKNGLGWGNGIGVTLGVISTALPFVSGLGATDDAVRGGARLLTRGHWAPTTFRAGELDIHFAKHAAEWGAGNITKGGYLTRARQLLSSDVGGQIQGFTRRNGDVVRYNARTNEFAVAASDGTIRTLFRPTEGAVYYAGEAAKR